MKYIVDSINISEKRALPYGYDIVGLYRDGEWEGRGNFCGWYATEYRVDSVLLAYYVIKAQLANQKGEHEKEVVIEDPKPFTFSIHSCMSERCFDALNDEEAIFKFFAEEW